MYIYIYIDLYVSIYMHVYVHMACAYMIFAGPGGLQVPGPCPRTEASGASGPDGSPMAWAIDKYSKNISIIHPKYVYIY